MNTLSRNARTHQQAFRAIVPDVHLYDLSAFHHESINVAIAFERRAVGPLAVERPQIVDDGLTHARHHVGAFCPASAPVRQI